MRAALVVALAADADDRPAPVDSAADSDGEEVRELAADDTHDAEAAAAAARELEEEAGKALALLELMQDEKVSSLAHGDVATWMPAMRGITNLSEEVTYNLELIRRVLADHDSRRAHQPERPSSPKGGGLY